MHLNSFIRQQSQQKALRLILKFLIYWMKNCSCTLMYICLKVTRPLNYWTGRGLSGHLYWFAPTHIYQKNVLLLHVLALFMYKSKSIMYLFNSKDCNNVGFFFSTFTLPLTAYDWKFTCKCILFCPKYFVTKIYSSKGEQAIQLLNW